MYKDTLQSKLSGEAKYSIILGNFFFQFNWITTEYLYNIFTVSPEDPLTGFKSRYFDIVCDQVPH